MKLSSIVNLKNGNILKFDTFNQFYRSYKEVFRYFIDLGVKAIEILDKNFSKFCPYPYLSTIMSGCIENSTDVTAGGTKYNLTSINGCGMGNTVDSIAAVKKIVYEDKKVTIEELKSILDCNFSGYEILRQILINSSPKYGNDDDYVDIFLKDLSEEFCFRVMQYKNSRSGKFQAGLYTVDSHNILGKKTGALPDGRLAKKSLSNGLSPSQGRDKSGPTAVMNSITKFDCKLLGNGMVLDMKFSPDILSNDEGFNKFEKLIKTYFSKGGMEIQINVVNKETLIKAQKNPNEYQNLVVRVSGFSNYFTSLDLSVQNEIINRTTYS